VNLLAIISADDVLPVVVFVGIVAAAFWLLSLISKRNSLAEDRLDRIGRPKSLVDLDMSQHPSRDRFDGLKDVFSKLGANMEPKSDLERDGIRVKLANAGFRSESATAVFQGIRLASLVLSFPAMFLAYLYFGLTSVGLLTIGFCGATGLFFPGLALGQLRAQRQKEIFLTLPDALDLLVVCVESGLGLDAGLRKVTDEMKGHAKVMTEELALANLQLQMGRPRREVLHDLGVRTGVDDVKSLSAILIQADRFGSSIAQALRVQSDSMRTRRRQIAEEKAAATAVKLIFPLVLFIFPAIFVVLVGPAAILISKNLLSKG
jgi:tight adherence protein C